MNEATRPGPQFVGNCRGCGYPLVRLPENRCPECGRGFDPENPRTMEFGTSRLRDFLSKRSTVWTWMPAFFAGGAAAAALLTLPPNPGTNILLAAAIAVGGGTWYITAARARFRRFMRKRNRGKFW